MTKRSTIEQRTKALAVMDSLIERGVPRNSAISWVRAKMNVTLEALAEHVGITTPRILVICDKTPSDFATEKEIVDHFKSIEAAARRMAELKLRKLRA